MTQFEFQTGSAGSVTSSALLNDESGRRHDAAAANAIWKVMEELAREFGGRFALHVLISTSSRRWIFH